MREGEYPDCRRRRWSVHHWDRQGGGRGEGSRGQSPRVLLWPFHLAKELEESGGALSPPGGAWWVGGGWGEAADETPLREPEPTSPLPGVPGPLSPLTCNKEIMLFLILYLPRMPVIFFLSESNFLLTFLPNVAKHDLCERTLLATCSLPRAPQELLAHSRVAPPSEMGKVSTSPGPLLCPRLLLPAGGGGGAGAGAGGGACFPGLSASGVPGGRLSQELLLSFRTGAFVPGCAGVEQRGQGPWASSNFCCH